MKLNLLDSLHQAGKLAWPLELTGHTCQSPNRNSSLFFISIVAVFVWNCFKKELKQRDHPVCLARPAWHSEERSICSADVRPTFSSSF